MNNITQVTIYINLCDKQTVSGCKHRRVNFG